MVAFTPRFAALFTFVSIASFSLAPLPTDALAVPRDLPNQGDNILPALSTYQPPKNSQDNDKNATQAETPKQARSVTWDHLTALAKLAQVQSKKRRHQPPVSVDLEGIAYVELGDGEIWHQDQEYLSDRSMKASKQASTGYKRNAELIVQSNVAGRVDMLSQDKKMGSLYLDPSGDPPQMTVAEHNATEIRLLRVTSSDAEPIAGVMLQIITQDINGSSIERCITYDCTGSDRRPLIADECHFVRARGDSKNSQLFSYDNSTNLIQLDWCKGPLESGSKAQGVLQRAEDGLITKNGQLKFVPNEALAGSFEATAPVNASVATTTMTTTVTVIGSPTGSLSAAEATVTSSDLAGSSSVPVPTSTTDGSAPTATSAGALDVGVVEPQSSSTAMVTTTSEAAAASSTAINAEDIASSIATSTTTTSAAPLAPTGTSSIAAMDNTLSMSSSTESSAAPTMTPFSVEPYHWVFRRE